MAEAKKFDVVVFGASGFTGQYVVEEIARTAAEEKDLKWAIAGRHMKRLQGVLDLTSKVTGQDWSELPIIIADVGNQDSLLSMCQQTKVVLNCVGPWLEKTYLNLNKTAQEREVYVIQACGFDSIPAEMGLIYTKQLFPGELNSVESYISFHSGPHGGTVNDGTWKSAIHSLSTRSDLRAIRERLYPQALPTPKVKLQKRSAIFFSNEVNRWCIPFIGTDKSIVNRTSYFSFVFDKQIPIQFQPYMALNGFGSLLSWLFVGFIMMVFSKTRFGIYLLEKFPWALSLGKFSSSGPTRQQVKEGSFEMTFIGEGFSGNDEESDKPCKRIVTRVKGPDAGYVTTPICMVQSAYVLLKEKHKMPDSFGVQTPGRAFCKTSLIERLQKHNIVFSTL